MTTMQSNDLPTPDAATAAIDLARAGTSSIIDLLNSAAQLASDGRQTDAAELYRVWLAHNASPLAYVAHFNLGVLLDQSGDQAGAEAAYRSALAQQPKFGQAALNLGLLLERGARPDEALGCWTVMMGSIDAQADKALYVQALNNTGRLLETLQRNAQAEAMFLRSLEQEPAQVDIRAHQLRLRQQLDAEAAARTAVQQQGRSCHPGDLFQPMVSVLIPTHNRPDYAELALKSALAQSYGNIEIVISDNSDDDLTQERFAPYVAAHSCIRYLRVPNSPALENFLNCYDNARADYVNFLMDDDLFHPEKISRMMACMLGQPNVGLVTSFRQLIDDNGNELPPAPSTQRLLETAGVVSGAGMGLHMLTTHLNVVGEPTTALFRKSELTERFGMFHGKQYVVISDMVTWLSILSRKDCVYLPEPLSLFRIHGGQGQMQTSVQIKGAIEGLEVLCDAYQHSAQLFAGLPDIRPLLTARLTHFIGLASHWHKEIQQGGFDLERIHAAIRQATTILLSAPATAA